MISVREAHKQLFGLLSPTGPEMVALTEALGRRLAAPVIARIPHPVADVSAMDGYAIRSADTSEKPVRLTVIGEAAAGHPFSGEMMSGQAVRLFTGAHIPIGADAVAIQEIVETDEANGLQLVKEVTAGTYVRRAGQDFERGDRGLEQGTLLGARQVALAAAMDHSWLEVSRRPRVAILSTGDELSWPGDLATEGKTVNSNSFGLAALVQSVGGDVQQLSLSPDADDILKHKVSEVISSVDLLVTSGGVSVGDHDRIRPVLESCGFQLGFWKIAMRPGKPLLVGRLGQTVVLGLPGNPVSALVCGLLFLVPALKRLQGASMEEALPHSVTALSESDLPENDARQDQLRARMTGHTAEGRLKVVSYSRQDSGMLRILAESDGLIVRPPHAPAAKAGATVRFIPFPSLY